MSNGSHFRDTARSHVSAIAKKLYGLWFCAVFLGCALGAVVLAIVVPGESRRRHLTRGAARLVFRLTASTPAVEGLELLPAKQCVVVANHASYLDGILMTAALPERFRFVIKREITSVPVVHFLLRRIGAHFVERSDSRRGAQDVRLILKTANTGGSLVFFPEGTFHEQVGIRRFRNGAFAVAFRAGLPIVPVAITGARQMLPSGAWLPRPGPLRVTIHPAFEPAEHQSVEAATRYCRDSIIRATGEPDLQTA